MAPRKAALYRGDGEDAAEGLEERWAPFNRSLLRRLPLVLTESSALQGGLAAARAREARRHRAHHLLLAQAFERVQRRAEADLRQPHLARSSRAARVGGTATGRPERTLELRGAAATERTFCRVLSEVASRHVASSSSSAVCRNMFM